MAFRKNFSQNSPIYIFIDVFSVECVLSKTPIVCAYFVVAWRRVMFWTSAISVIKFSTKVEFLCVILNVGRYARLVMKSMITFPELTAV